MCRVADKIKFCTCTAQEVDELPNYWIFYRYDKSRNVQVVGQPILPTFIPKDLDLFNRQVLLQRVNEPDAFDVDLQPHDGDRLEVHFDCPDYPGGGYIDYGFEYRKGAWKAITYDLFAWLRKHEQQSFGELNPPLQIG